MAFLSTSSIGDDGSAERFRLQDGETVIGRHPDCHIVVDAGAVSRYHAKVVQRDGDFLVEDSGSRNGTFLNGQLLSEPEVLREGDRVRISDVELVFHQDAVPEFAQDHNLMTFDGSNFGIMMVEDAEAEKISSSKVEFRSSSEGLKLSATAEAKLEALMRINSNLSNALGLDEVLPKVLNSLFDIFPAADRGFVVMEDANGNLVPRWVKTRQTRDESETVRISRTIIREVMKTGEAILSLDASEDTRFDSSQSIADFSIRSMICAPLIDGSGQSFGALQIDSLKGRGQFREEDTDLLSGVAAQAGVVINNARLHEQALHQREVEQDLKLATEVQQAFLPQSPPDAPGYQVCSFYQAANHIGGDYFDYIHLADGRVAVVVADVVGHGVAAAMFMAKLSAETRFCLASDANVAQAVERLNDRMSRLHVERFVTFLLVVIDPTSDSVTIVNAGHMAPVVRLARDGKIVEPGEEESGLPIAIDDGMSYESVEFPMAVGDVAVLYTDGINEAMDEEDNEFGIDKVRELTAIGGSAEEIKDRLVKAVLEHVGEAPPFDDMCLVVIERLAAAGETVTGLTDTADQDMVGQLADEDTGF
ncbi:protein serine/threonine phosphatase with GAF(s) sensor(s) [Rhodopirellula maiorica SM1]|uniref:Protein serine/threonine phosphatase with GAF(S) sensor(S) n=1 Tax=Rhodopirellula maiorica SM1 TaxID=1265738 RepID=M5RVV2_9BACT|nr:SpoIIE family protein phosphatase [Rhodopirellula maiorica]EMI19527.1 protein serine/threonine phosphatase with GAF(s) sensor(s) [Rhodopirellula maiorica SM1]